MMVQGRDFTKEEIEKDFTEWLERRIQNIDIEVLQLKNEKSVLIDKLKIQNNN